MNALNNLVLAVAILRDSVSHIREQVIAAISAETCALEVCFEDLKNGIVLGSLSSSDNTSVISALFETCCSKSVSDHAVGDFGIENHRIDVAWAFLSAQYFLTSLEDLVELVDHATLECTALVQLLDEH